MSEKKTRRLAFRLRLHELPLLVGLILLWCALWQDLSAVTIVSGAFVALAVVRIFYLPPVRLAARFNPFYALFFVSRFFVQLFLASMQLAWLAVRPAPCRGAILRMRLRTDSDFLITLYSLTVSLVPGSLVCEVDRFSSTIYLHVINVAGSADVERLRADLRKTERLMLLAFGDADEARMVK